MRSQWAGACRHHRARAFPLFRGGRKNAAPGRTPGLRAQRDRETLREHDVCNKRARLAGRVCGDSTVAYAWAYAMAAEDIAGATPPDRALWLRALFLERERIANHLGDLGYLGNDVAFAFGFAQFCDSEGTNAAQQCRAVRASLSDGQDHSGRRCGGSGGTGKQHAARGMRDAGTRGARAARHLRRACRRAGPLHWCRAHRARGWLHSWGYAVWPGAPVRRHGMRACSFPARPMTSWTCRWRPIATAMSRRASSCASTSCSNRCVCSARSWMICHDGCPVGRRSKSCPAWASAWAWWKAGAAKCWSRYTPMPDGNLMRVHPHDPSWQNWPVLEHAVHGQHRAGFSADQQIVQSELFRARPLMELYRSCCATYSNRS